MGSFYNGKWNSFSAGLENRSARHARPKQQAIPELSEAYRHSRPFVEVPLQCLQVSRAEVAERGRLAAGGQRTGAQPAAIAAEPAQGRETTVVGQLVFV